jgi:hypothetical protein
MQRSCFVDGFETCNGLSRLQTIERVVVARNERWLDLLQKKKDDIGPISNS